jgi:hypothetical protein
MGITLPPKRRQVEHWSYIRMKADVARFAAGRTEWPRKPEFNAAGLHRLYLAIQRAPARERLAADLGLRLPPNRQVLKGRWTEPAIKATLDELLEGRTIWPCRREFVQAGLGGLEQVLQREGTREEWARRYGVLVMRRRAR